MSGEARNGERGMRNGEGNYEMRETREKGKGELWEGTLPAGEAREHGCLTCASAGRPSRAAECVECLPPEWKNWRKSGKTGRRERGRQLRNALLRQGYAGQARNVRKGNRKTKEGGVG